MHFTEADESFDSYLLGPIGTSCSQSTSLVVLPSPCGKFIIKYLNFHKFSFRNNISRRRRFDRGVRDGSTKSTYSEFDH